jgi:hypothetical protein
MGHVPHDALQTPQFFLKHAWTDVTPKIIIHVLWLYKSQRKNDTGGGGTEALTDEKKRGNTETKEENEKKTRRKHRNKNNTKRDRTRKHTQERGRGKTIKKKQKEDLVIDSPDPTKEKETKELFFLYKKGKTIIFFNLSIAQREGNVAKAELPG